MHEGLDRGTWEVSERHRRPGNALGRPGAAPERPRAARERASGLWNELRAARFEHEGSKLPLGPHLEGFSVHFGELLGSKTRPERVQWYLRREPRFRIDFRARFVALAVLLLLARILAKRPGTL